MHIERLHNIIQNQVVCQYQTQGLLSEARALPDANRAILQVTLHGVST